MVTIWGRASSSNVQAVMWGAAELGLVIERIDAGGGYGGLDTPSFLEMNPNGLIPVMRDGDLTLFESAAILRHLARAYGDDGFWPVDPARRARVDQWSEWAKQEIANRFTGPIFWRVVRTPAARHDPAAIRAAVDRFETALAIAEARLARSPWLAGDTMTPGDIHLGHVLYRYFDIAIDRRDFPALRAYYGRLTERPAYAAHVMLNYDELRDTI
ncbi:glutathione S-transferase family protein [Thalassococcus sp. CAU 1522]|uniref:Glutathione S-transferase family protein n=1 Tax=Thalassococcus arenae TaxID=2851652 RepID=A0ABS6N2G9_9RHOB|nr:glutathione S-transferase family protein [Thalassococcus arenae]MBV2358220.1 glutathione S-transferase family protein [Thalassococcus arenae]